MITPMRRVIAVLAFFYNSRTIILFFTISELRLKIWYNKDRVKVPVVFLVWTVEVY